MLQALEVDVQARKLRTIPPAQVEYRLRGRGHLEVAAESRMRIAQPDQRHEALDDGS